MTKVGTIGGAVTLALLSTVLVSTATALPFTQAVSGGPVDPRNIGFPLDFSPVGQSEVDWQGVFPPASGLNGIPVHTSVMLMGDVSFVANFTGNLAVGFGFNVEHSPLGVGVFGGQEPVIGSFGETVSVVEGTAYSFSLSETVDISFPIDIDPSFDFVDDFLLTVSVFAVGGDYEDNVSDLTESFSYTGLVTVGEVPEPALATLFGLGTAALALGTRRQR